MSIIVAFRSRTVTQQAYNFLINKGVSCSLISTPREANVGCGLSVQFAESDYQQVYSLLGVGASTFAGYYRVSRINGSRIVVRI